MGAAESKKDPIEELSRLLYQKEATGHCDTEETMKYISQLKSQLEDKLTQEAMAKKFSEGWGINMLEEWLVVSDPSEEECKLMAGTTDIFISLLEYESIRNLILEKRLVKSFTTLAFSKPAYAIKGVEMMESLASIETYQPEMISQNAIQTMLLLIPTEAETVHIRAKLANDSEALRLHDSISRSAMTALLHLAKNHAKEIFAAGSINSLIELAQHDVQNITEIQLETISLCLKVLSRLCVIVTVTTRLLSSEITPKITEKLNNPKLQESVCELLSSLCKDETSRRYMQDKIPQIIRLARNSEGVLGLKARTCLVCVCFSDENYEYLTRRRQIDIVQEVMLKLDEPEVRLEVATTLNRLSTEAKVLSQPRLLIAILQPLVLLLDSEEPLVIALTTKAILRLTQRNDMQKFVHSQGATKKLLSRLKSYLAREDLAEVEKESMESIVFTLCILTNHFTNVGLLSNRSYVSALHKLSESSRSSPILAEIATLTLCCVPEIYSSNPIQDKLRHALSALKNINNKIVYKAIGVLSVLAAEDKYRILFTKLKGVERITSLLESNKPAIVSQAAQAISNLLVAPDGLELWLKLDTLNVCDAANLHMPVRANIGRMTTNSINEHWGHKFSKGDVIEIRDIAAMSMWTLGFWFLMPLSGDRPQIVVQGHKASGAILAVFDSTFCIIDEHSGQTVPILDLKSYRLKNSWQHFSLVYSDCIKAYLNGLEVYVDTAQTIKISQRMQYFCNGADCNSPFKAIADIRLYRRAFKASEVEVLAKRARNVVDGLPDKMAEYINLANGVNLLHRNFIKNDNLSKLPVIQALANLATKASLRGSIIRSSFLPLIVAEINSPNPAIKFHACRLIVNLG
jgi:hypothetical protein